MNSRLVDTPSKIITAEAARPLATGHFDVLPARAEMVAALAMVDYVVSLEALQIESLLAAFPAERIVRVEAAHQQLTRELIEHVRRRSP